MCAWKFSGKRTSLLPSFFFFLSSYVFLEYRIGIIVGLMINMYVRV
jgi:hypothetical protein